MKIWTTILTALVLLAAGTSQAAVKYNIVELPLLPGGTYSAGARIKNAGQVVGSGDVVSSGDPTISFEQVKEDAVILERQRRSRE